MTELEKLIFKVALKYLDIGNDLTKTEIDISLDKILIIIDEKGEADKEKIAACLYSIFLN